MLYCGLDFGTTNTKAVLLDEAMRLRGLVTLPIGSSAVSDQLSANVWLDHFYRILDYFQASGVIKGEKVILSISAQGGSFVVINKQNQPISPAWLWTGNGNQATAAELERTFGKSAYYRKTGWEPKGWLPVCKFKEWLSIHKSEVDLIKNVVTVPDYISSQLTGRAVTDITNAQMTGMFGINMRKWDEEILLWAGCKREWMSDVLDSPKIFAEGLCFNGATVSLTTSSHDQYAAMRAAGMNTTGDFMLGTGTAWVLNGKSESPMYDEKNYSIHPGCDLVGRDYGYIATMGAVGQGFEKLLARLNVSYEMLAKMETDLANLAVPQNAVKIDMLKGTGNSKSKSQSEIIRRYMEAVGAKVRILLETLGKMNHAKKIIMTGGAANSNLWPAIIAGICNIPVDAIRCNELTAYGAAIYARMAGGAHDSKWCLPEEYICRLEPIQVEEYEEWYQTYQKPLYERKIDDER
jgi:sugar (pentulose or hexulose) kinase